MLKREMVNHIILYIISVNLFWFRLKAMLSKSGSLALLFKCITCTFKACKPRLIATNFLDTSRIYIVT